MTNRTRITFVIYGIVNAVLFGTGAIIVLSFPEWQDFWKYLLPVVIGLSFVLAGPAAWFIAPRLRARYWR